MCDDVQGGRATRALLTLESKLTEECYCLSLFHNVHLIQLHMVIASIDSCVCVCLLQAAGWCPESKSLEWSKGQSDRRTLQL